MYGNDYVVGLATGRIVRRSGMEIRMELSYDMLVS